MDLVFTVHCSATIFPTASAGGSGPGWRLWKLLEKGSDMPTFCCVGPLTWSPMASPRGGVGPFGFALTFTSFAACATHDPTNDHVSSFRTCTELTPTASEASETDYHHSAEKRTNLKGGLLS